MKKSILISLVALTMVYACNDDNDPDTVDNTTLTTTEKIQNKWILESIWDNVYVGSSNTYDYTDTIDMLPGDYMDFRSDDKLYMKIEGDFDTTDYLVIDDQTMSVGTELFEISYLSSSEFVLTFYERTDTPFYDNVVSLRR